MTSALADVRAPVDHQARHALALRRLQQPVEAAQRLGGVGVVDPAVALQQADALLVAELGELADGRVQVRQVACRRHHHISTGKGSTEAP